MQKLILILIFFFSYGNVFSNEEYFLTLRNERVNLRQGPSFDYPVKIFYKKKFLPVLIQDKSDNFRKIRDHENNKKNKKKIVSFCIYLDISYLLLILLFLEIF